MAVIQGISGIQIGDGVGGKIALSVDARVLKILRNMNLTYLTATIRNSNEIKFGSVTYYKPEIIQTEDYGDGTTGFDAPQAKIVTVNLDTRRTAKWEYEEFDLARLGGVESIIGVIANGLANAIQADLNAHFWMFITDKLFNTYKSQNIVLPILGGQQVATVEQCREAINTLKLKMVEIGQTFTKEKLGVPYSEMLAIMSPKASTILENAFWGQQGGKEIILGGFQVNQFGKFRWIEDNMLGITVAAGSSFSKDKQLDTSNLSGVILHNEAIAMPINTLETTFNRNPVNANPRWIHKYQFGIELLRPELLWGIVVTQPTRAAEKAKTFTKLPKTPNVQISDDREFPNV